MRILMVNKFLYPRAGAETYMLRLSEALINEGHEVAFFGMDHENKTTLGKTYTVKKIEFGKQLNIFQKSGQLIKAAWQNLRINSLFKECCEDFKPDLIHAHNVYNQLPPNLFSKSSIPVIMTAHDYKPVCPSYNLFTKGKNCYACLKGSFTPCIMNKCVQDSLVASTISAFSSWLQKKRKTYINDISAYIAPSRFMKNQLVAGGIPEHKVQVINNFTDADKKLKAPGKGLLYAGRICKEKGVDTLIEAYMMLNEPKPSLTICGTGPLKKELQNRTAKYKLDINWTGYVKPKRIQQELQHCQAVIVPSIWNENCSMTIMESLANGRPVISSDAGGSPELINPGYNGFIFKAGDVNDLKIKLLALQNSNIKQLANNAAETGKCFYSNEFHLAQILDLYKHQYLKQANYQNSHIHTLPKAQKMIQEN